jgi:TRAP-type C4-dicarboxylate transport system permease small subunit
MGKQIHDMLIKMGKPSNWLCYVGALSLFGMMCLTAMDVIGRYIFNAPITGVFEITEFLVLILIFSFIGYTQSQKTHVAVDMVVNLMPKSLRFIIELVNHLICFFLMGLITWMGIENALELKEVGEATPNLTIPTYPFVFFLVMGCAVMCLEYLRDIITLLVPGKERDSS